MGALIDESATLKLYTSLDDEIWFIDGKGPPLPSGYEYTEYCKKPRMTNKKTIVRVVGCSRNSSLITTLYDLKQTGNIKDVQVCSPLVEKSNLDEYSPEKVLFNMRKWLYAPSVGGFHSVTSDDNTVYKMINVSAEITDVSSVNKLTSLLATHSTYDVFKFIPFVDLNACALLVSTIVDPRWYIDLNAPNKLHNLFNCLGISSLKNTNDFEAIGTPHSGGSKIDKRNIVLMSWRNNLNLEKDFSSSFLIKTYAKVRETFLPGKIKPGETPFDEADLATSQKFISFLFGMWLHKIYPYPNNWREHLFIPEYFFATKEEVERYKSFFK